MDTPPPSGAGGATPSGPSSPAKEDSKIPIHAGFDFNAIKDVLGKAELNPDELRIRDAEEFEVPPIPPPTNRSESAPPPQQTPPTEAQRPSFGPPSPEQGPSSMSATFSRSMSVNDVRDDYPDSDPDDPPPPPEKPPVYTPAPTLSFADNTGSLWSPDDRFEPRDVPAFGYSAAQSANPFSTYTPPDTGLSFGGADGSITSTVSPLADPWTIPTELGKKKSPAYNANPWG
jgi:hypothetical protein